MLHEQHQQSTGLREERNKIVRRVMPINDDVVLLQWQYRDEDELLSVAPFVNVVIASHVTAMARLKLLEYMNMVEEDRILYVDTDSVISFNGTGQTEIPTGDYLGDMTDELEKPYGPGSYITRFVGAGAKNYAYEVRNSTVLT